MEDKQPIGDYATSAYIDGSCEALSSGLTGWVDSQGYLTEHQDINGKANKDEMNISAGADRAVITLHTGLSVSVVTEHQSLENYYAKNETSSAAEIAGALDGKQPSGEYATSAYVNEGHGYTFDEPLQVTDLGPAGKSVHLDFQPSDYYTKGVFDECLSAVRQYNSPEEVPLSAVVNAIWCLSRLQEWVTPDELEEEPAD